MTAAEHQSLSAAGGGEHRHRALIVHRHPPEEARANDADRAPPSVTAAVTDDDKTCGRDLAPSPRARTVETTHFITRLLKMSRVSIIVSTLQEK